MDVKIKVSVHMITYGHELYIKQAIESVLMQETNFDFELFIADDCSPDKTPEVVESILNNHPQAFRIKYHRHKKNIGMKANGLYALDQCLGKYIAFCEGDDYWTDPHKLQKQVDFLENNTNYSICWTKYLIKQESQNLLPLEKPDWISHIEKDKNFHIDLNNIFAPYCTYTLTAVLRRNMLDFTILRKLKHSKDNSIYALCLSKGNGMLMDFYSSAYRVHGGGIFSGASIYKQKFYSYLNLKEIILKVPDCDNDNIRSIRNHLLKESIKFCPNRYSFDYLNLIWDFAVCFGFKKSLKLVVNKLKNGK